MFSCFFDQSSEDGLGKSYLLQYKLFFSVSFCHYALVNIWQSTGSWAGMLNWYSLCFLVHVVQFPCQSTRELKAVTIVKYHLALWKWENAEQNWINTYQEKQKLLTCSVSTLPHSSPQRIKTPETKKHNSVLQPELFKKFCWKAREVLLSRYKYMVTLHKAILWYMFLTLKHHYLQTADFVLEEGKLCILFSDLFSIAIQNIVAL